MYQAVKDYKDAEGVVAKSCEELRKRGQTIAADNVAKVKKDLAEISKQKYDTTVFLGVLDETPDACFIGMVQKLALRDGSPITQLNIWAITRVQNQAIFYYTFAPYRDDTSVKSLLAQHKSNVAAFLAANKGG
jgi:hypothetical protein